MAWSTGSGIQQLIKTLWKVRASNVDRIILTFHSRYPVLKLSYSLPYYKPHNKCFLCYFGDFFIFNVCNFWTERTHEFPNTKFIMSGSEHECYVHFLVAAQKWYGRIISLVRRWHIRHKQLKLIISTMTFEAIRHFSVCCLLLSVITHTDSH